MLNKVQLIGNVGQDPQVKEFDNGGKVANFTIATTEKWKNKQGEAQERTEWHRIAVWQEGLIRVIEQYVKKGDRIYIEGQLETRSWEDTKSGEKRYQTEVTLRPFKGELKLLGGKPSAGGGDRPQRSASPSAGSSGSFERVTDDEIPF